MSNKEIVLKAMNELFHEKDSKAMGRIKPVLFRN